MTDDELAKLFEKHRGKADRILRYEFHIKNEAERADILGDAWKRACQKKAQLRENDKFLPWLRVILKNLVFDKARRAVVKRKDSWGREVIEPREVLAGRLDDPREEHDKEPDIPLRPLSDEDYAETRSYIIKRSELRLQHEARNLAVREALAALPEESQRIIEMRFWEGATYESMAKALRCSRYHAKKKWEKAKRLFKESYRS